ncbi:hypothetical protein DFJ43DRAFT_1043236 [Lentinula guzmanii]|uniref:Uncharacterized protein n=3 Tax=Lentinula TaxID=5352 RepID=A0AA38JB78_9AGAR|nr:hypothetical protein DFJ43DRAFT_1043236 [Lentinula guzmanii]KAJ3740327.1 hypothetical protein DFH05DRAFT_1462910 [Lentinula detonsa]KAJ3783261.1 hypothetical protein GGU10DRAFT_405072 [Lentinula aff. detonsa]
MARPGNNIFLGSITADSMVKTVVSIDFHRQQHTGVASPLASRLASSGRESVSPHTSMSLSRVNWPPALGSLGVSPLHQNFHLHATGISPSGTPFRQTLHTSASQDLPSASLDVQTRRPLTQKTLENRPSIQPIYKQVKVGYPVDAQALEERQRVESHKRAHSLARLTEGPAEAVDSTSTFLQQSNVAASSVRDRSSAIPSPLSPFRVPYIEPTPQPSFLEGSGSSSEPPSSVSAPAIRPRMGAGEQRLKRRTTDTVFVGAVRALSNHVDDEVKRIASEFKRSLLTVKKLVGVHRRFRERKAPSLYNALLHRLAQKRRDVLAESDPLGKNFGSQHQALAADEDLQVILQNPESAEAQEAIRELMEYQEAKFRGTRASAKANDNDIVKTWGKIANTSQNLSHRTSAATFGFVCSSKPGQNVTRQFFGNGPIEAFLMSKFGMTGEEFVESAESYFIYTSAGRIATGMGVKKMQKEIVRLIAEGLREVTKNEKLSMEYDHYDILLVKEYGVRLVGWPEGVRFLNPHKLHASDVIKLYNNIHQKVCRWKKLDGREFHEAKKEIELKLKRGELTEPERHRRGKKRQAEDNGDDRGGKKAKKGRTWLKGKESGSQKLSKRRVNKKALDDSDGELPDEEMENSDKPHPLPRPRPVPRLILKEGVRVIGRTVLSDSDDDNDEGQSSTDKTSRPAIDSADPVNDQLDPYQSDSGNNDSEEERDELDDPEDFFDQAPDYEDDADIDYDLYVSGRDDAADVLDDDSWY